MSVLPYKKYFSIVLTDRDNPDWNIFPYNGSFQYRYSQIAFLAWICHKLIPAEQKKKWIVSIWIGKDKRVEGEEKNQKKEPAEIMNMFPLKDIFQFQEFMRKANAGIHMHSLEELLFVRCLTCKVNNPCRSDHHALYFLQMVNNPKGWLKIGDHLYVSRNVRVCHNHPDMKREGVSFLVNTEYKLLWISYLIKGHFRPPVVLTSHDTKPLIELFTEYQETDNSHLSSLQTLSFAQIYKEMDEDIYFDRSNPFLPPEKMEDFNTLTAVCLLFDWCMEWTKWSFSYGGSVKPLLGNMAKCTDKSGLPHYHQKGEDFFRLFYPDNTISTNWEAPYPSTPTSEYDTDSNDEEWECSDEEDAGDY
jgi:hypothetical protein